MLELELIFPEFEFEFEFVELEEVFKDSLLVKEEYELESLELLDGLVTKFKLQETSNRPKREERKIFFFMFYPPSIYYYSVLF